MGIFDIFKKKKKKPEAQPTPSYAPPAPPAGAPPVDYVISLQQQGYTNNQIIQVLQRQGYQPSQIYDAISEAERMPGPEPYAPSPEAPTATPLPERPPEEVPKSFEEMAEAILEEKWQEFRKEHAELNEWKDQITGRVERIEQSVSDFKSDLDTLHKAIVSKISEYDKNLLDVGTEIKAMEKVFQKVLPELTGSVAELSRITKAVKGKPKEKPETAKKKARK